MTSVQLQRKAEECCTVKMHLYIRHLNPPTIQGGSLIKSGVNAIQLSSRPFEH